MTLATATPQQLVQVEQYTVYLRGLASALMKVMSQMNSASNTYNSTITEIIGGSGTGTAISDNSGLAGIDTLTDTDVVNITFLIQSILSSWYDANHQQLLTRACGTGNTLP